MRRRPFNPFRVLTTTGWWIVAFAGASMLVLGQLAVEGLL
jgi:hypothetical protein